MNLNLATNYVHYSRVN